MTRSMDVLLDRVDQLHSSPQVACKVLTLLQDDDFSMSELIGLLESDPALATSILKLVNSSYFGVTRCIASIQQAVTLMGARTLRLAVLSFGLAKHLVQDGPAEVCSAYWQRSLTTAAAASAICQDRAGISSDEAYTTGLLADIGILLLAQAETESYVEMFKQHGHCDRLFVAERERYGFDHAQLGGHLLTRWKLPECMTDAISRLHTGGDMDEAFDLVLRAADLVADSLWTPHSAHMTEARKLLESEFQIDVDDFISLAMDIKQKVNENAELFQVRLGEDIDCEAVNKQAREICMHEAIEAALDCDSLFSMAEETSTPQS